MAHYFVTGGFGFLGQYIVQALLETDPHTQVTVLGRTARRTFLEVEKSPRVRWVQSDLSQPQAYRQALQQADAVIHAAALISFRKADAQAIYQANVLGTRALTEAALQTGVRNFIFISSISAVGRALQGMSDETHFPDEDYKRTHDMYGYSKLISERELRDLRGKLRVITLNPSVIIGPGSERLNTVLRQTRYLPLLPVPVYVNSFVDVRDVAQAVLLALHQGRSGERYIVTSENVDMLSFTRQVVQAAGRRARVVPLPRAWFLPLDGVLTVLDTLHLNPGIRRISEMSVDKRYSTRKIQAEMGWQPRISLAQSLADTVQFTGIF
ncbi:MAG: NAD-dependent epimerase/dehydratase family protein [Anaerolineae bacterium]|nr:MAG: NAD-dependent epimerase/dehydratase family protein [Anaerolineae bacterium]